MEDKAKERFLASIPKIRDIDIERINQLFPAYVFRIRREREVWTSCCHRHELIQKDAAPEILALLDAEHSPEPIVSRYWTRPKNEYEASRRVTCPWCGATAKMKELGRSGNRDNLFRFRRPVILRQYRGALWVIALDAIKKYNGPPGNRLYSGGLTALPDYIVIGAYKYQPGKVEYIRETWFGRIEIGYLDKVTAVGKGNQWLVRSPFGYCSEYGTGYDVIGWEELDKSFFRYCGIKDIYPECDLFRLLTLACFYPRQVEFLHKLELDEALSDYTEKGVKNADAIHWDAERPKDFLDIPKDVIEKVTHSRGNMLALRLYRKLIKTKDKLPIEDCIFYNDILSKSYDRKEIEKKWKGVPYRQRVKYLQKQMESYDRTATLINEYKDYLHAAEGVGLDLENRIFLFPRDLKEKHDEVTAAYAALLRERREAAEAARRQALKEEREKAEKAYSARFAKLKKKYEFTYDGMQIIVPNGAEAIVQEGKNLHHCVGGYADRHLNGKTTILFLRRAAAPDMSLVTIEINNNTIKQVHGWDDERSACPDNPTKTPPEKIYAWFFDPWLRWLTGGSKRNKDGSPKLPKIKREAKTA